MSVRIKSASAVLNLVECRTVLRISGIHPAGSRKTRIRIIEPSALELNTSDKEIPFCVSLLNGDLIELFKRLLDLISGNKVSYLGKVCISVG